MKLLLLFSVFSLSYFCHAQDRFLSGYYVVESDTIIFTYSERDVWINDSTARIEVEGSEITVSANTQPEIYLSDQRVQSLKIDNNWNFVNTLVASGRIKLYKTLVSGELMALKGNELMVLKSVNFKSDLKSLFEDNSMLIELTGRNWVLPNDINQLESLAVSLCQQYNIDYSGDQDKIKADRIQYKRLVSAKIGLSTFDLTLNVEGTISNFINRNLAADLGLLFLRRSKDIILLSGKSDAHFTGIYVPMGLRYFFYRKQPNVSIFGGAQAGLKFMKYKDMGEKHFESGADFGWYAGLSSNWPINAKHMLGIEAKYHSLDDFGSFNFSGTFTF
ncbi:MAG: hypothetical protein ABJH98_07205 [Reichenbachiella sp.]|uniref:outer membrane beta-barrel protein n=1 Tax=Reichenbachiella sp. TaxID=2184521 RepID=UPI0032988F48